MRLFVIVLVVIGFLGAVAFFSMPAIKEVRRSRAIDQEIENLQEEADKISADNSFLKDQVEYLKSDHYKERLAKDKLNLRNPGEQVVVVQPSNKGDDFKEENSESLDDDNNRGEKPSNFQKWLKYFFK